MTKSLNDVQVGDKIVAMGTKRFTSVLDVTSVDRYDGSVVCVKMAAGQFWPMMPGQAQVTKITVQL